MSKLKNNIRILVTFYSVCLALSGCKNNTKSTSETLFILKDAKDTGIDFHNNLDYSKDFNVYKYRNFYNGGGVALGDINNDGLIDVYLVSNQKENKLYLNKGNWKFEDITTKSGAAGQKAWSTGVTMVDINADGFLDIYVCNSGDVKGDNKENELFINNGNLTFREAAAEYGLNDKGYSTHASFFDYDKDGDLDAYILNNSFQAIGSFNLQKSERNVRDELGGDKLLENRNGKFVDVSEKAGIYGSVIGFGLGITIGDVNNDNWEDIYISNDFFERDYLYINQKNGTFKEDLVNQMPSICGASMGADIADINNDGYNEIFVTEMMPSDYSRLKTNTTFEDWNRYQYGVKNGYHHQFTRNTLQLNNGNGTFSEVSRMLGVNASDWSWGALFFDMDNDGNKDLFIANGIYKDLTNQDYLQYIANESVMETIFKDEGVDYKKLIDIIPSTPVPNHAYKNNGNLNFELYKNSGLLTPSFSNGSAYGDLDNDGDLDLVVNNVNMPSFVYENTASQTNGNNFIKLILKGEGKNINAYGARITVSSGDQKWYFENQPIRGFQSSMDPRLNIGIGKATQCTVKITWPSGKVTETTLAKINTTLTVHEKDGKSVDAIVNVAPAIFQLDNKYLNYTHVENLYSDFNREALNAHMLSTSGPNVAMGDINGDKLIDIVVPGAKGSEISTLVNRENAFQTGLPSSDFKKLKEAEHVEMDLFDADGDGDLDLYAASGGVDITEFSDMLHDNLFLNDGHGKFTSTGQQLPISEVKVSTGAVAHSDIDGDGDQDLFVGERVKVGSYGLPCSSYILVNDGKGNYTNATSTICPSLQDIGMVTDAVFTDLDGDKKEDLIVVGEFMDVTIYKNQNGKLVKTTPINKKGWWNTIDVVDIDNDGDLDIALGNHGLNSRFKAGTKLFCNDFDGNGFPEALYTEKHDDGKDYPYALRHNLTNRLPGLKKKYPDYESFKNASITDIFPKPILDNCIKYETNEMQSMVLINNGKMTFESKAFPRSAQVSPIFAITHYDVNNDGFQDLIIGGNLYNVQPEIGRYDASYGHVLINDKKNGFIDQTKLYGLSIKGEVRDMHILGDKLIVFRNNNSALSYSITKQK